MIDDLVARVFVTRNLAHLAHWKTKQYSEHVALGEFYASIIESIDSIVEAFQGHMHDRIGFVSIPPVAEDVNIVDHLKDEKDWIESNRSEISGNSPAIENLIDGLVAIYAKACFMLSLS